MCVLALLGSGLSRYMPPQQRPELFRLGSYVGAFVTTTLPILHRVFVRGNAVGDDHTLVFWGAWLSAVCFAGFVLGSFLPERHKPGIGDLLWRSHHISHVCSGVSAYIQYYALLKVLGGHPF
jgi:hypothetical protein